MKLVDKPLTERQKLSLYIRAACSFDERSLIKELMSY